MATVAIQDGDGQDSPKQLKCLSGCTKGQEIFPECEVVSEGDAGSLETLYKNCPKNPGHPKFIPVKEFTSDHLPGDLRNQETMDLIRMRCDRTVRIQLAYTSKDRPDYFTDNITPYPYAQFKGSDRKRRYGTGTITDSVDRNLVEEGPCPCPECKKSGQPKMRYCQVTVVTAAHVIFDTSEAEQSQLDCFVDSDDGKGLKTLHGLSAEDSILTRDMGWKSDMIQVKCVSHECDVIEWLSTQFGSTSTPFAPRLLSPALPPAQVIVSHPHGCSKTITVGRVHHVTVPIQPNYQTDKPFPLMAGTRCRLLVEPDMSMTNEIEGQVYSNTDTKTDRSQDRPIMLYPPPVEPVETVKPVEHVKLVEPGNDEEDREHVDPHVCGKNNNDVENLVQHHSGHLGTSPNPAISTIDGAACSTDTGHDVMGTQTSSVTEDGASVSTPWAKGLVDFVLGGLSDSLGERGSSFMPDSQFRDKLYSVVDTLFKNTEGMQSVARVYSNVFDVDIDNNQLEQTREGVHNFLHDAFDPTTPQTDHKQRKDFMLKCLLKPLVEQCTSLVPSLRQDSSGDGSHFPPEPGMECLIPPGMTFTLPSEAEYAFLYNTGSDGWFEFPPGTIFTSPDETDVPLPEGVEFKNEALCPEHCFVTYDTDTCPGSSGAMVYCDVLGIEGSTFFPHCFGRPGINRSGVQLNTLLSRSNPLNPDLMTAVTSNFGPLMNAAVDNPPGRDVTRNDKLTSDRPVSPDLD